LPINETTPIAPKTQMSPTPINEFALTAMKSNTKLSALMRRDRALSI
jgi:hypothetical protein